MVFRPPSLARLRWRRRVRSLLALLLLSGLTWAAWAWLPAPVDTVPLVHIIDGDSLTVRRDGETVTIRLTYVDAIEYRQDCQRSDGLPWPCGRDARAALARIAGRGPLYCTVAAKDRYDRSLAACRTRPIPDGIDLGAEMVRQGWAVATSDAYLVAEGEAQARRRGIWAGRFMRPAEWRTAPPRPAAAMATPDG